MDPTREPGLQVGQVFMSSARFAHREDVLQLPHKTDIGEVNVQVAMQTHISEDKKGGMIILAVRTLPGGQYVYDFEIEMVGLVQQIPDQENMSIEEYVEKAGASMLFPFLREAVANITARGRFGPLWLKPINVK